MVSGLWFLVCASEGIVMTSWVPDVSLVLFVSDNSSCVSGTSQISGDVFPHPSESFRLPPWGSPIGVSLLGSFLLVNCSVFCFGIVYCSCDHRNLKVLSLANPAQASMRRSHSAVHTSRSSHAFIFTFSYHFGMILWLWLRQVGSSPTSETQRLDCLHYLDELLI
jgi:hypothetical protein